MTSQPIPRQGALAGLAHHQAGDLAAAHRSYAEVLRAHPDDFHANLWLGVLLHQTGRYDTALSHLQRAAETAPDVPDAWVNLAAVRQALGQHAEARSATERALGLDPALAAAWLSLGNLDQAGGDLAGAERAYRKAVSLDPGDALARFNLATALARSGRFQAAADAARACLERAPEQVPALGLLADALTNLGRNGEALDVLRTALERAPQDPDLWSTRGVVLAELGRLAEARDAFDRALASDPNHGPALANALFTRRRLCDWRDAPRLAERFRQAIGRERPGLTPFSWLAEASTRREQRDCARLWSRQWPARTPAPRTLPGDATGRLTVAYLSADLYQHPTAYLAAGLFEQHDRERFRIIALSNSRDDGSPIRRRLEAAFDAFIDIRDLAPGAVAERVRSEGVDILVDLKGHTLEAATAVLAERPAPIQVQYLGYPGTMGAPFVDYLVGDDRVTPAEHQPDYDEHLVRLPGSYQVNDRNRPRPPVTGTRASLGLPGSGTVFCCFNNAWKLNDAVFATWMRILRDVPDSVLWLLGRESASDVAPALRAEAVAAGVPAERLVFSKSRPLEPYLALYHHADLFLDSWPYNAHTTASDALWMGCPVLTLEGDTFAGRVGASLLEASGLEALICRSPGEYHAAAVGLAQDRDRLAALRRQLDEGRAANPLFDTRATTRALERAYEEMARRHRSASAGPFRVPAAAGAAGDLSPPA